MRLSGLSLAITLVLSSFLLAQHSSGGGSSGGSSSNSSGGGSHSSYSSGSSGGGSHSSGGGHSSSAGSGHTSGGSHGSGGSHASSGMSTSSASSSHGKTDHGSNLVSSPRAGMQPSSSKMARPIHEPKSDLPQHVVVPEKRGFFSFLRHPFHKPQPKVVAQPALYLPRPICAKGRCTPACPVGQVYSGGGCITPNFVTCGRGPIWNNSCGYPCSPGEIWNGGACLYHTRFLDSCLGLRTSLERQIQRVQAAEAARRNACGNGPAQECSQATAGWQSEENLRRDLLMRYQQCRMQSMPMYSARYGLSPFDSSRWLDSLRFSADF